ncbi:PH domain-containing protein [Alkalicoccobacillus murimartini]|uniref:Membrane protein YdbS with pleckstrin-like domain n=1 Tax=Alkalicoccobacillus murimartini TaxID=171685 RepID=A0ABT9YEQ7_9BACI|nr:PH domain-containing protein [Alkalicoccobacillus murimartini]MDQ0205980.1 membrane protein YdbS with pleckstrin-like domain [Alkalicoccobacillus murimartini]
MREVPTKRLSKKSITIWRIQRSFEGIFLLILPIGYAIALNYFDWPSWILIVLISILVLYIVALIIIWPPIQWRRFRYQVLEQEIDIVQGVVIVRRTLVPMTRIQHVETEQGPILRRYKMASVEIQTAATTHRIPVLPIEEADELRDQIARLAAVALDE